MVGEDGDMHKRAFQGLKRMHVSDLPPPYFLKKNNVYKLFFFFKSKYAAGRPETCINVRFRA